MNLRYKFIVILLLLLAILYANYPNFLELLPDKQNSNLAFYQQKEKELQSSLQDLHNLNLFIVEKENNKILVVGADLEEVETLQSNLLLNRFFKDYEIKEEASKVYLYWSGDENDLVKNAEQLNNLVLNAKKIESITFQRDNSQLFFAVKDDSQISLNEEPIKTFLADDLDWVYDFIAAGYSSRLKKADLLISLGLDLKGGIYLDLDLDLDTLLSNVLKNLAVDLRNYFNEQSIFLLNLEVIDSRSLQVRLDPSEVIDWQSEELDNYLNAFEVIPEGEGLFTIAISQTEIARIQQDAIDQVINTLNNRIDLLGVKEPSIQKKGDNSIVVQLPGQTDPARARRVIQQSAKLEFRFVVENGDPENPENNLVLNYEVKDSGTGAIINVEQVVVEDIVMLAGDVIREARVIFSNTTGLPYVSIDFDSKGAADFAELTEKNVGRQLAIILDNKIQSYPVIQEAIYGGQAQITGSFSNKEASDLALVLRSGSLPTSLVINEERTVGASLGEDSVRDSVTALLFGFLLVILLLAIYYQLSGLFCIFALLFNILFIFAALSYFKATLTLPGMAGIILTVGMAVDANILIFERIKEELKQTSNIKQAVKLGFSRSSWTIVDANVTTLLAAAILFYFGTGPIKGFSVTLSIGIIASLFSSLFITRFFFELFYLRKLKVIKLSI